MHILIYFSGFRRAYFYCHWRAAIGLFFCLSNSSFKITLHNEWQLKTHILRQGVVLVGWRSAQVHTHTHCAPVTFHPPYPSSAAINAVSILRLFRLWGGLHWVIQPPLLVLLVSDLSICPHWHAERKIEY